MIITTRDDIKRLGTIMGIWAHPDDETFGMGGTLAAAVFNGQKVVCLTATKGEGGVQDESRWPADQLADIRANELKKAMEILGVKNQYFLGYEDGRCAQADSRQAVQKIADYITEHQPDSIFTFGPDGMTGHPDHQAVSAWAAQARKRSGSHARLYHAVVTIDQYENFHAVDEAFEVFFNTDTPPVYDPEDTAVCITLDDWQYAQKIAALQAMPSQYADMFAAFSPEDLRPCLGVESFALAETG